MRAADALEVTALLSLLTVCLSFLLPFSSIADDGAEVFSSVESPAGVYSAVFSPTGKYVLTGGMGFNLRLWDAGTGRETLTFLGPSEQITSVINSIAFTPDGSHALTGGGGPLKLWEVPTGKQVREFHGRSVVRSVAVSQNGKHAVSGDNGHRVTLWDLDTGKKIWSFAGHRAAVRSVAFSPDGKYVFSGSDDRSLKLWDVKGGKEIRTFGGHMGPITSVACSPDGKHALSGSHDKTLKLWEVATGRELRTFLGHTRAVTAVAFSPDGRLALSGSEDRTIRLWNPATGRESRRIDAHSQAVASVGFSPDGKYALSSGTDKTARLWDLAEAKPPKVLQGLLRPARYVATSPDGRYAISGTNDSILKLWDITLGREVRRFDKGKTEGVDPFDHAAGTQKFLGARDAVACAFSPKGEYLLAATEDAPLQLRETATGKEILSLIGHEDFVPSIAFSRDGKYGLSGSLDKTVKLWDLERGREARTFSGHALGVISVAFAPDEKHALSAARDGTVKTWDLESGRELRSFKGHPKFIRSARFSPDGRTVVLGGLDSTIRICDLETGREIRACEGHSGPVNTTAFSPDGKHIVSGGSDRSVRLWEVLTGKELKKFTGHSDAVNSAVFTPDGRRILSAGEDGTLRIWDVASARETLRLNSFTNDEWLAVAPEGYFNASAGGPRLGLVRTAKKVLCLENLYEKNFDPGRVARRLAGEAVGGEDIRKGFGMPPEVRVVTPRKTLTTGEGTVSITVEATDQGGGIGEIRLFHNGAGVESRKEEALLRPAEGRATKSYEIALVPGNNILKATAFGKDGAESDPSEVEVKHTGGRVDSQLYLVLIAISRYRNASSPVDFPIQSAKAMKEFFQRKWKNASGLTHLFLGSQAELRAVGAGAAGAPLFSDLHLVEVYDENATKEGVQRALSGIKATPQDVVLIYFAGQSGTNEKGWFFFPYGESGVTLSASEVSGVLRAVPALKKVVFLDSHKLGTISGLAGVEDQRPMALIARSTGAHVLSASIPGDLPGTARLEKGLLSEALLRGLNGEAESLLHIQVPRTGSSARDRIVSVKSLTAWVLRALPELSREYSMPAVLPAAFSQDRDFPLVINRWDER